MHVAPVCAWVALRGSEVIADPWDLTPAVILGLAVLFWVAGFDIIYACQDYEFDRRAKLNSVPVRLGIRGALRLAAACHAVMVLLLVVLPFADQWAGLDLGLGWLYGISVGSIAVLLVYEHWLVRPHDLRRVGIAFFNINALVSIGLFLATAVDLLWI